MLLVLIVCFLVEDVLELDFVDELVFDEFDCFLEFEICIEELFVFVLEFELVCVWIVIN